MADKTEQDKKARREAYTEATSALRAEHPERFSDLYGQALKRRNIEYKPRLTPEQKAAATLDALIEEFPDLRQRFAATAD